MLTNKANKIGFSLIIIFMVVLTIMVYYNSSNILTTSEVTCKASSEELRNLQQNIESTSSSGGGIVTMEACLYILEEPIYLKSNVHLKGEGIDKTVIKLKSKLENGELNANKAIVTENGTSNVTLSDLTIDGNKEERAKLINSPYAHSVDFANVNGFEIDNIKVVNSTSASIMLYNSKNGSVKNTTILNSGSNGILALRDIENIKIQNNTIDHTDHQNGIFVSYQEGHSSHTILIDDNTVKYAADFGIEVGHIVPEGHEQHRDIIVKNNEVIQATNSGIAFRSVSDGTIVNNIINGYGKNGTYGGDGIFVEGGFNTSSNVTVLSNVVKQVYNSGDANAIYVTGIESGIVKENQIEDSRGNGVFVQASVLPDDLTTIDFPEGKRNYSNIEIVGNKILNNEKNGIHFQGNASKDNTILMNLIRGNKEYGIQVANLTLGNRFQIEGNEIVSNEQDAINIFKQNQLEIVDNTIHPSKEDITPSLSFVFVNDVKLRNNLYISEAGQDFIHKQNVENLVNENNKFESNE